MSNSALTNPGTAPTLEGESRDPVAEALKLIEQTHVAIATLRARIDDSSRMLAELARISAVFDSVGDRLVNATFKASRDATRGVTSHAVLVSFIEELGDLARISLGGSRDIRRELRVPTNNAVPPPAAVFHQADEALRELSAALKRIAQRPVSAARPAPLKPIEIETRSPPPVPRLPSALERALTEGVFAPGRAKSGGYKN